MSLHLQRSSQCWGILDIGYYMQKTIRNHLSWANCSWVQGWWNFNLSACEVSQNYKRWWRSCGFQKYIINILDSGNLSFQPNASLRKRFLSWGLLPLAACFGMETGWRGSIFCKNWLWQGLDSLTVVLTSWSSMFVFIAHKKKEKCCPILCHWFSRVLLFSSTSLLNLCWGCVIPSQPAPFGWGRKKGKGWGGGATTPWYCINSCFIIIKKKLHSKRFLGSKHTK